MADQVELQQTGNVDAISSLQGKYLELELDGKIVNFNIKSIGDVEKNTSSGTLQFNDKERAKTMEQQMEQEKAEEIFSLVPDCMFIFIFLLHPKYHYLDPSISISLLTTSY